MTREKREERREASGNAEEKKKKKNIVYVYMETREGQKRMDGEKNNRERVHPRVHREYYTLTVGEGENLRRCQSLTRLQAVTFEEDVHLAIHFRFDCCCFFLILKFIFYL